MGPLDPRKPARKAGDALAPLDLQHALTIASGGRLEGPAQRPGGPEQPGDRGRGGDRHAHRHGSAGCRRRRGPRRPARRAGPKNSTRGGRDRDAFPSARGRGRPREQRGRHDGRHATVLRDQRRRSRRCGAPLACRHSSIAEPPLVSASISDGTSPRASMRWNTAYTSVFAPALRNVASSLSQA